MYYKILNYIFSYHPTEKALEKMLVKSRENITQASYLSFFSDFVLN